MLKVQEINSAIIHGDLTLVQLNSVIDAVKFKRKLIGESQKASLFLGDRVQFRNSRTGAMVIGVLRERKIKNAIVEVAGARWRVPFTMLEAVE